MCDIPVHIYPLIEGCSRNKTFLPGEGTNSCPESQTFEHKRSSNLCFSLSTFVLFTQLTTVTSSLRVNLPTKQRTPRIHKRKNAAFYSSAYRSRGVLFSGNCPSRSRNEAGRRRYMPASLPWFSGWLPPRLGEIFHIYAYVVLPVLPIRWCYYIRYTNHWHNLGRPPKRGELNWDHSKPRLQKCWEWYYSWHPLSFVLD